MKKGRRSFRDILFELHDSEICFGNEIIINLKPITKSKSSKREYYIRTSFLTSPTDDLYNIKKPHDFDGINKWLRGLPLRMNEHKEFSSIKHRGLWYICCPSYVRTEKNKDVNEIIALPNWIALHEVRDSELKIYPLGAEGIKTIYLSDLRKIM